MLRNLSVRAKLLVLVVVPLLVLVGAAVVLDVQRSSAARETRDVARFAASSDEGSSFVVALQRERLLSLQLLAGSDAVTAEELATARTRTDAAETALDAAVGEAGEGATAAAATGVRELAVPLRRVRATVTRGETTAAQTLAAYSALVDGYTGTVQTVADGSADRDLARGQGAFAALLEQHEAASREQAAGLLVLRGLGTPELTQTRVAAIAQQDAAGRQARSRLSGDLAASVDTILGAADATGARARVAGARADFAAAGTGTPALDPEAWLTSSSSLVASLSAATAVVADDVAADGEEQAGAAVRSAVLFALGSLLVLALVALLGWALVRDVGGRLRRVTAAATRVREDLPALVERASTGDTGDTGDPVPAGSVLATGGGSDEVGRLGAVVDDLQATALRVAREQAALRRSIAETFVNVARRDQTLLARQLAFLDQLERTETDPDTLEDLFTLDHLATRMRRNAESLLVLAGINTGRRLRRALPLSDVIRTAAGEIEHYDRIDLSLRVDPPVTGHLALTVAHLVAELLENATSFSDPGSRVVVSTSEDARGVVVEIADSGLGMDPDEIEHAQQRISGGRASEFVGAQRLGFFVVGRLAGRLDIDVHFDSVEGEGTTVTLVLSPAHFVPGSVSAGQPELRALDAAPFPADPPPALESPAPGGPAPRPAAAPGAPSTLPRRSPAAVVGVPDPLAAAGLGDALS
ncbi:hypothetical protein GTR02_14130, partial [Kineococcus sp. R8]|uniref:sensor histidine kinase n=1 Tax=Kineococcus siccus TaxID=2696567 RepID=UPI0014135F05